MFLHLQDSMADIPYVVNSHRYVLPVVNNLRYVSHCLLHLQAFLIVLLLTLSVSFLMTFILRNSIMNQLLSLPFQAVYMSYTLPTLLLSGLNQNDSQLLLLLYLFPDFHLSNNKSFFYAMQAYL